MAIIPNLRSSPTGDNTVPKNFPYSDVLFDYAQFLRDIETAGKIAEINTDKNVAIIGAGASGICAAYELLRAGIKNLTIFSPNTPDEIENPLRAGRCFSYQFPGNEKFLAEMGSMRFPLSEVCLFHYLDAFKVQYNANFPDPGQVDTLLYANGKPNTWKSGEKVPPLFQPLADGFNALIATGCTLADSTVLVGPEQIATKLKALQLDDAQKDWQKWIDTFEAYSFRAALTMIFQQSNTDNIPNKRQWTDEQISLFGTLGVGSGGFGPLYSISFLEIMRLFVNELETKQQFIPTGIGSLFKKMEEETFNGKTIRERILRQTVIDITMSDDANAGRYAIATQSGTRVNADVVIVTSQTWASQVTFNLTDNKENSYGSTLVLPENIKTAVRNQHIIESSKAFMLTKDHFWKKNNLPANIQSDTLVRGLYCLEYTDNPDDPGVVLLSYVWEDDSGKQVPTIPYGLDKDNIVGKEARIKRLVRDVSSFEPTFAKYLVPIDNDYEKNTVFINWSDQEFYRGAFKLNRPGQSAETQAAFTQFQTAVAAGEGLYLAGDCVSFYAGWVEGALQTGLNAATAALTHLGATNFVPNNPMRGVKTSDYNYSTLKK